MLRYTAASTGKPSVKLVTSKGDTRDGGAAGTASPRLSGCLGYPAGELDVLMLESPNGAAKYQM